MREVVTGAIATLLQLGYSLRREGENLKATYHGPGAPDPAQVKPLLKLLKAHKAEALAYLQGHAAGARGRDCQPTTQVGQGYAISGAPERQDPDRTHPGPSFPPRIDPVPEGEPDLPRCHACPWCVDNPWTHHPELPKWCGWWWNHLEADRPQCRDRQDHPSLQDLLPAGGAQAPAVPWFKAREPYSAPGCSDHSPRTGGRPGIPPSPGRR